VRRLFRGFGVTLLLLLLLPLSLFVTGCGGSNTNSKTSTSAGSLSPERAAVVSFYRALVGDFPARKASLEAAVRLQAATAAGHVDLAAAERAIREYLTGAEAWQKAMQALPAESTDLESIRAKYVEAAADEARFVRDTLALYQGIKATGAADKTRVQQVKTLRGKQLAANYAAENELNALVERLGGEAAFHGTLERKHLEELVSSMREQAGG
jgi:hypothetical protein